VTDSNLSLLVRALDFAAKKHAGQVRKDQESTPYINHPIGLVDVLVNEADLDDTLILAAALLHDTVEDTSATPEEIEANFGEQLAACVMELTDDKSKLKEERKRLQIVHASGASYAARVVKLADKICNLRDMHTSPPPRWDLERRREYYDWAKSVIDELRGTHAVLESLFDAAYSRRP